MEFQDVIRKRKMIRSYLDKPIDREIVDHLLDNAIRAPSAGFSQGWGFLVLDTPEDTARFWAMSGEDPDPDSRWGKMRNAPVIIIPMANKQVYLDRYAEPDKGWTDKDEGRWPMPFWIIDTAFAAENLLLTVTDLGLAALFFGIIDPDLFRKTFNVPEEYEAIGAITVGYPAPDVPSPSLKRGRRSADDVVRRGNWS